MQPNKLQGQITRFYIVLILFSTFNGAVRKWLINSSLVGNIILFTQLLIPFLFFWLVFKHDFKSPYKKFKVLHVYTWLLLLLAINPMNETLYHGILGFILHIGFWLIVFFYATNREIATSDSVIKVSLVICCLEFILGFVQYNLPPSHFLNQYADNTRVTGIATIGDRVRITGTFSYLGGLSSFLVFQSFLGWTALRRNIYPRISLILLLSGVLTAVMTGSRSTVFLSLLFLILILGSEYVNSRLVRQVTLQVPIFIGIVFLSFIFLGDRLGLVQKSAVAWDNFNGRVQRNRKSGEEKKRIIEPIIETINFKGDYPLIGIGLGATYQGATALFGTSKYVTEYGYLEEEWERVVLEGGFVLFVFRVFLFVTLFKNLLIPKTQRVIILIMIFVFIPIIIHTYNAFFLAMGIIILDQSYNKKVESKETVHK